MRQGSNSRRPRSRGNGRRHPGGRGNNVESNGPDVKIRGTAQQVLEKYLALAHDASSAGDRVAAEAYYQYADHYYRVINGDGSGGPNNGQGRDQQPKIPPPPESGVGSDGGKTPESHAAGDTDSVSEAQADGSKTEPASV